MSFSSDAQTAYINTPNSIYKLTTVNGECHTEAITPLCENNANPFIFSIAVYRDTLYYISGPALYKLVPGSPSTCTYVTNFENYNTDFNSLTVDKYGMLYAINNSNAGLYKYNPYTHTTNMLGYLPQAAAGDMMFYKNKLLYTTWYDGIYEISLDAPSESKKYMATDGYIFFGILSLPFDCVKNKIYGIAPSNELIELDLENRKVLGLYCTLNLNVYDAASNVDDGNTIGIGIDAIKITGVCSETGANLAIQSYTAGNGSITYQLDNAVSNTTGQFSNVSFGNHSLHLYNQLGCVKDSTITVARGLSAIQSITSHPTTNCYTNTGSILVTAQSAYPGLLFSIDNGPFQPGNLFSNLKGGPHTIVIRDSAGCSVDTTVATGLINRPVSSSTDIFPAHCSDNGRILVKLAASAAAADFTTALDNGPFTHTLEYTGLKPGNHVLAVMDGSSCRYDTLVEIKNIEDKQPAVQINTTHQHCFSNNGKVIISILGDDAPYQTNFNSRGWQTTASFINLAPEKYPIAITNKNGCRWDTSTAILPYSFGRVSVEVKKIDPDCDVLTNGQLKILVAGTQPPYTILMDNRPHSNDTWITNLGAKQYFIQLQNADGCFVDSLTATLSYNIKPQCDTVIVPNAFTPNADGNNDFIKPLGSILLKDAVFTVFNRYGQKLFESRGPTKGWDGKSGGRLQPGGGYVWVVQYKNAVGNTRITRGTFLLLN